MMDAVQAFNQLDGEYFSKYETAIRPVLNAMDGGKPFDEQIELAGKCLQEFWGHYSSSQIATILQTFPRVQRALFGLEEDIASGSRYRDHYVHMFNVFITGSIIISGIVARFSESARAPLLGEVFKATNEPSDVPFESPYSAKRRLFFLWTLIATFHDVGIPVEHLGSIRSGLNRFLGYFGLTIGELNLQCKTSVDVQLEYYFKLMSKFYNGVYPNERLLYNLPERGACYVYHSLASAYGDKDHGLISAICLFNSFEETFLTPQRGKYELGIEEYERFISHVLEHDIARAAYAISLHSVKRGTYPKLFPVDFRKLPLTFLLILCDEMQEAYRHEGLTFTGVTKLSSYPEFEVTFNERPLTIGITVTIRHTRLTDEQEKTIVSATTTYASGKGVNSPVDYKEFLGWTWENICTTLREKLLFLESPIRLRLQVFLGEESILERVSTSIPPLA